MTPQEFLRLSPQEQTDIWSSLGPNERDAIREAQKAIRQAPKTRAAEPPVVAAPANTQNRMLSRCPACKREVSIQAPACPHCGHILKESQSATGLLAAIIIGLLIFWFLVRPLI
jgi:hypothetical protein